MNLTKIFNLNTLEDLAIEVFWKTIPSKKTSTNFSWPLYTEKLKDVLIRWPSKYQWPRCRKWVEPLLYGFRRFVKTEISEIPQPYGGIVLIQFVTAETLQNVAIDYSDFININEDCAKRCSLYFKMQYSREGYSFNHILPGGYVPADRSLYELLSYLRAIRDRKIFSYDVYGRFTFDFAEGLRKRAVSLLTEQKYFRYEGGQEKVRYSRFLREVARSKICIDLPGEGDFCFRLIDYFAIGSCVIGPKHRTILHSQFNDREHIVYVEEDFSDLVPLCKYYLENDHAREKICRNSRSFFDKYLHRNQLAAYYLHSCLERLT